MRVSTRLAQTWRVPGLRGFTLVELMITITIAAVLAMIAVPSFHRLMLTNRLNTSANALVGAINLARMDAIKLDSVVQFCGSTSTTNYTDTLGTACGTNAGAVYSLPQSASSVDKERVPPPGISAPLQISSDGVTAVRFSGQGIGYAPDKNSGTPFGGNIATICTAQLASKNKRIISMATGSVVATASSTGTCP